VFFIDHQSPEECDKCVDVRNVLRVCLRAGCSGKSAGLALQLNTRHVSTHVCDGISDLCKFVCVCVLVK
jgi:hypothetical protein